jgi:hypothetical protein
MARFNKAAAVAPQKTVNLAGGEAFVQSPELELVSQLLTSFVKDQFYRSADDGLDRLRQLIPLVEPEFAAKAAVYARQVFGMRSISHVLAAEVAPLVAKKPFARDFYEAIVARPDDMTEIAAYYFGVLKQTKLSAAMKAGFRNAFDKFDRYQLAKYRGEGKAKKLVDIVNLVRPKGTEGNSSALADLVADKLRTAGSTWESRLSKAGQAENKEDVAEEKAEAWRELVRSRKIGYFALLRNLRNILTQAPDLVPHACELLIDEKLIRNSKVLPFRYMTAYEEIAKSASADARMIVQAINKAIDIACVNCPQLPGQSLVVLDTSSSMNGRCSQIGALFAAVLAKGLNADTMTFDGDARYLFLNHTDSISTLTGRLRFDGGSTNFHAIFQRASRAYDRIFILSDMQGWVGYHSPSADFATYKRTYATDPFVYSWDLAGHGTMQFPERKVFALAGFSDKAFDLIEKLEEDPGALINTIKALDLKAYTA